MTTTSRQLRKLRQRERKSEQAIQGVRSFSVRAKTINDEDRSVEAVIASETPVEMFDWELWETVPEVLLVDGMQSVRGLQVPLLDSHNRGSVSNQLGSVRNIEKDPKSGTISGRLYFSSLADDAWTKVREGHLTDISVGYLIEKRRFIPEGHTEKVSGREFTGPISVATRWVLREASVTPIGADELAKMRGYDPLHKVTKEFEMDEKLRARCVAAGMDASLENAAALEWLNSNHDKLCVRQDPAPPAPPSPVEPEPDPEPAPLEMRVADELERRERTRREQTAAYAREVDTSLRLAFRNGPPADLRARCIELNDLAAARQEIFKHLERAPDTPADYTVNLASEQPQDRHRTDLGTALSIRALIGSGASEASIERVLPVQSRGRGWETFRQCRLLDFATECLLSDGYSTRGLTREQIAVAALGWPEKAGLRVRSGDIAYHTTGAFLEITRDALNKSMLRAYQEAPSTWRGPMRQGDSVADFKNMNRVQLGAIPNLPIWPDNTVPTESSFADANVQYAVEAYSTKVSFSWRLVINDDMSALSRVPAMMGAAAARTVNAKAWEQVTSNPTMPDAAALFLATAAGLRFQVNLETGAGAPSVTTIGLLKANMRVITGVNTPEGAASSDILNISSRYIVGPAALETVILQQVRSIADPLANLSSAVYNPNTSLVPVIEPLLDASSITAWYLFADPAQIDTVEVTFLQGQETPLTNDWADEATLSRNYIIVQTFAAKALDWRGMQKHAGA